MRRDSCNGPACNGYLHFGTWWRYATALPLSSTLLYDAPGGLLFLGFISICGPSSSASLCIVLVQRLQPASQRRLLSVTAELAVTAVLYLEPCAGYRHRTCLVSRLRSASSCARICGAALVRSRSMLGCLYAQPSIAAALFSESQLCLRRNRPTSQLCSVPQRHTYSASQWCSTLYPASQLQLCLGRRRSRAQHRSDPPDPLMFF